MINVGPSQENLVRLLEGVLPSVLTMHPRGGPPQASRCVRMSGSRLSWRQAGRVRKGSERHVRLQGGSSVVTKAVTAYMLPPKRDRRALLENPYRAPEK